MRYIRLFLLMGLALIFLCLPCMAQEGSITINNFHTDALVNSDGTVTITETIQVQFWGIRHGLYRDIPVEYNTPQGFGYRIWLDILSIKEGVEPLKYEISRTGSNERLKIYVPNASNSVRTIILQYSVEHAMKFWNANGNLSAYDHFYWNVTGDQWQVPIQAASATITLPEKVKGVRVLTYQGRYQSKEAAAQMTNANIVQVEATRPLSPFEGLSVEVAFNPGVVQRPSFLDEAGYFLRANWVFCIPILVFITMVLVWRTYGKDPRLRPIAAQYEPPEGMTPAEMGTLIDNKCQIRDMTASLVDLAVRGFLVIEQHGEDQLFGLLGKRDYTFTLKKKQAEWTGLQAHERELLDALFGSGMETVRLSDLQNKFYTHVPLIRNKVYDALLQRHYYLRRPDSVQGIYIGLAVVVAVLAGIGSATGRTLGITPTSLVVAGILSAVSIAGFGWFMPTRTILGSRVLEGILGFEEFLRRVEEPRFARVIKTPEMFEKFLPYAMAMGVESNWAKAFEGIYKEPPSWYRGGIHPVFYPSLFVSDLGHMTTSTASTFTSTPRSSGGSGFSGGGGGGFSGGGFGGGGGGSF